MQSSPTYSSAVLLRRNMQELALISLSYALVLFFYHEFMHIEFGWDRNLKIKCNIHEYEIIHYLHSRIIQSSQRIYNI